MREMFRNFFEMFATLFSAGNKGAKALENVAEWGEKETAFMVERSDQEREVTRQEFQRLLESKKQKDAVRLTAA